MLLVLKQLFKPMNHQVDWLLEYKLNGDPSHLEALVDLYANDLLHFLQSITDNESAKDLVQRTWLTLITKRHYYKPQGTPKAYIFTIARNALHDDHRYKSKFVGLEHEINLIQSNHSSDQENTMNLYQAICLLPFEQKEALTLQLEGFSLEEIALITTTNQETIKTRLRYAKHSLKRHLGNLNE
ncbi:RNA polymerase sigma factor [Pseudoalteromonas xiamenensis]|uniref:RNA polymerase sigma factor n=1 Tax=Pseudoalteromonas xiamenensis TaxID=882626 RepID=UPI0027E568BD|nr:RNA polymerase sigma factor [Pseudoalteromonas xiamenensis]WMN60941.1 RNA polymerase sigma factor [Pseudoalteromonas xiamenensis]